MEEWLNNIYLEGLGGSNEGETSGLLLYFLATHSRLDSVIKRRRKGYLILTGDECPLPRITREEVREYLGENIQRDLAIEEVVAMAKQLYHVYFLLVDNGAAREQGSRRVWSNLLGAQNVITAQIDTISEQIAMLVVMSEGSVRTVSEAEGLLLAAGADRRAVKAAGRSLVKFTPPAGPVVPGSATGRLPGGPGNPGGGARRV